MMMDAADPVLFGLRVAMAAALLIFAGLCMRWMRE